MGINGGSISKKNLSNPALSRFPNLRDAYVDLEVGDEKVTHTLPDSFIDGEHMPSLKQMEFYAFIDPGQKEKFLSGTLARRLGSNLVYDEPEC